MNRLIFFLLFFQIQIMAQSDIILCRNFPCKLDSNYYSFIWNGRSFSRYSNEFLLTYEETFLFESKIKKYFELEKNHQLDSIVIIDNNSFLKTITLNRDHKKILLLLEHKGKGVFPRTSVYLWINNAVAVENFLDWIIDKHDYYLVDTLSNFTVKNHVGMLLVKPFENKSKLYFIDSNSTTYFLNDYNTDKKYECNVYNAHDGSEIYLFTKIYYSRSDFKSNGCTDFLNKLSKNNLLIRSKGVSLDSSEACFHWIAIDKNRLSHNDIFFLDSLSRIP